MGSPSFCGSLYSYSLNAGVARWQYHRSEVSTSAQVSAIDPRHLLLCLENSASNTVTYMLATAYTTSLPELRLITAQTFANTLGS